ncbi:MAG: Nitroreductase family protein [Smithella sp. PtaU1.Bin162]|nr:MAG: Nitroreductase family protein [Smithella sp. PtaU1.Bin162]
MPEISALIKKRISCRTYALQPLNEEILQKFASIVTKEHAGPFGNKPLFRLINPDISSPEEWKNTGTYGVIKNARLFLAGKIKKADNAVVDYGYCMETLILQATALGLGTCWLAGTFNASGFAKVINRSDDELLPAVSPIGYPTDQKSFMEKIFRRFAGSNFRKPWPEMFFAGDFTTPLTEEQAGKYAEALENVRLAPSASNKQPWRIVLDNTGNSFHFYLDRAFGYTLREVPIQDLDMGIAMNHFEYTAKEIGISGSWKISENPPKKNSLDYMVSWQENF